MARYTGGGGYLPLVSVDPATTAWVNAVITNGGSVSGGMAGFLTATEVANLYSRIRTYMTAVGVP